MSVMAYVQQENAKLGGTSLPAPTLSPAEPLQPFEKDQLKYLINQIKAASPRVREALVREIFPSR